MQSESQNRAPQLLSVACNLLAGLKPAIALINQAIEMRATDCLGQ